MCPLPLAHAETLMCCHGSCPGASGQPAEAYTLPGQDNVLGSNIKHEAGPVQPHLLHSAGLKAGGVRTPNLQQLRGGGLIEPKGPDTSEPAGSAICGF